MEHSLAPCDVRGDEQPPWGTTRQVTDMQVGPHSRLILKLRHFCTSSQETLFSQIALMLLTPSLLFLKKFFLSCHNSMYSQFILIVALIIGAKVHAIIRHSQPTGNCLWRDVQINCQKTVFMGSHTSYFYTQHRVVFIYTTIQQKFFIGKFKKSSRGLALSF